MFTHYQRIWQFNFLVVWPLLWLAYTVQHGLNAVSGIGGVLVLTGRRWFGKWR